MQLLKSNPDGTGQTIETVNVVNPVEYARQASEGGFVTLLGEFQPELTMPPQEPKPGDPPPPAFVPTIQAVFNNGSQIINTITGG